jgi:class 3 adenylate cyclase|eukprot:5182424-Prymnesium_polylepis.3
MRPLGPRHPRGSHVALQAGAALASGDLAEATRRAAQCALALQNECGAYPATPEVILKLHIGVGSGPLNLFLVGGAYRRWECVAAGQPINQVGGAEGNAEPGEVCLSPEAWALVGENAEAVHVKDGFMKVTKLADVSTMYPNPMRPVFEEMVRASPLSPRVRVLSSLACIEHST